jgi:hypothetical protein
MLDIVRDYHDGDQRAKLLIFRYTRLVKAHKRSLNLKDALYEDMVSFLSGFIN